MYQFDYTAHFIVSDKDIDLGKYEAMLTGFPLEKVKKGEDRYDRSGNKLNRKASLSYLKWRLHLESKVSSEQKPLDEVVLGCIRQIDAQKILFQELRDKGAEAAIEVALRPCTSYSVLMLSPGLTERISKHGIQLDLCVVVPPGRLQGR